MDRTSLHGVRCSDKAAFGPLCRFMACIALGSLCQGTVMAQPVVVWRCPGPPVLYTDRLTQVQAQQLRCEAVADLPVAVGGTVSARPTVQSRAVPSVAGTGAGTGSGSGSGSPATGTAPVRVDAAQQRSRDVQARRILEAELRREEERLAQSRERSQGATPRTPLPPEQAEAQQRIEADIEAIRRELSRLR